MKKIDAHLHINLNGLYPHNIIEYLDTNDIETCWLLTWEEENPQKAKNYKHLSVDSVLDIYQKYPGRIVPFYAPAPAKNAKFLHTRFTRFIRQGIRGCGELKSSHLWQDDIIDTYLNVLRDFDMPLLFHMEAPRFFIPPKKKMQNGLEKMYVKTIKNLFNFLPSSVLNRYSSFFSKYLKKTFFKGYLYDFMGLEKMLLKYPKQIFIAHGPHFWNNFSTNVFTKNRYSSGKVKEFGIIDRLLEEYPNLYCDISGGSGFNALSRDLKASEIFLNKHHSKILFGTDNYYGNKHENLIKSFKLSKEKLEHIFYENAIGILSL